MPSKQKSRRKTKSRRRRWPQKKDYSAVSLRCSGISCPLPQNYTCNLTYSDNYHLTGVGPQNQVFRMNSVFDPDFTGTGHQPLYFDQLATLYNRYRVNSCKIVATCENINTGIGALVNVIGKNDLSNMSTMDDTLEYPNRSKMLMLGARDGKSTGTIVKWFSPRKVAGASVERYRTDDLYSSDVTTNPSEAIGINIVTTSNDESTNPNTWVRVRLVYNVTFFDRKPISSS